MGSLRALRSGAKIKLLIENKVKLPITKGINEYLEIPGNIVIKYRHAKYIQI